MPMRTEAQKRTRRQYIKQRRISVVIFVNAPTNGLRSGGYSGGQLVVYGLIRAADSQAFGLPLDPERGMLVAFRSKQFTGYRP